MRAVWLREFGGPEVLVPGEAPDPVPKDGQVLVEVEYANITFVETQLRAGATIPYRLDPPVIPGNGVGGTVVLGERKGMRVVTSTGGSGGYAEYAAVDANGVFEVPDGIALDAAVALLADGRTAHLQFEAAQPKKGERVLVEAAAGGVGSLLVQLAKNAGLTVVAAVGNDRKAQVARSLGADEVILYQEPGWEKNAGDIDIVFDGVGGEIGRAAFTTLREGGRMSSFGLASGAWTGISEEEAQERGITLTPASPTPEQVRAATAKALDGTLTPLIGQRFPLERAADAHRAIETRATVGKTLLEVRPTV
ncbi:zinc-binding dehydrogenase [Actinomadura atramentaria]|uniref:zinc-binding dehydrogenase n=1 Tax=Actinomadura atramentaria TaxID=1990 RepID=UPI0003A57EC8|nr:zinc-binding dehydrogenase [Actinomadura atramentaria]